MDTVRQGGGPLGTQTLARVPNHVPNSANLTRPSPTELAVPKPNRPSFSPSQRSRNEGVPGSNPGVGSSMATSIDLTIVFDPPDEDGWIVARVLEVPGAMSQGRTRDEARENALDALRTVLLPTRC